MRHTLARLFLAGLVAATSSCKERQSLSEAKGVSVGYTGGLYTVPTRAQVVGLYGGFYPHAYFEAAQDGGREYVRQVFCAEDSVTVTPENVLVTKSGDVVAIRDARGGRAGATRRCDPLSATRMPMEQFERTIKFLLMQPHPAGMLNPQGAAKARDAAAVEAAWRDWRGFDEQAYRRYVTRREEERDAALRELAALLAKRLDEERQLLATLTGERERFRPALAASIADLEKSLANMEATLAAADRRRAAAKALLQQESVDRQTVYAELLRLLRDPEQGLILVNDPSTAFRDANAQHANVSDMTGFMYEVAGTAFSLAFRMHRDYEATAADFVGVAQVDAQAPTQDTSGGTYRLVSAGAAPETFSFLSALAEPGPARGGESLRTERSPFLGERGCAGIFGAGYRVPTYADLKRDRAELFDSELARRLGDGRVWITDRPWLRENNFAYAVTIKPGGLFSALDYEAVELTAAGQKPPRHAMLCFKPKG